ncbi:MAG: penicillin-binding transpeptidase domain-containing protein [Acidobacteriaceae bacterium]|nr:penicillin-binding transpeptidase domain-containing protein [Acidobacteriaceae bacterium]
MLGREYWIGVTLGAPFMTRYYRVMSGVWIAMAILLCSINATAQEVPPGVRHALQKSHASLLYIDVFGDKTLARYGELDQRSTPGSTVKPFVLKRALLAQPKIIGEHETIHCTGNLTIKGHNLACTHPRDITVLDAQQALANSCNTYFATLARRMSSAALLDGLREDRLTPSTQTMTPDDRALLALGLSGIEVSPRQLAAAYRSLAQWLLVSQSSASVVIADGLRQSVETGMAHGAKTDGVALSGKTGTAPNRTNPRDHGWFAGIVFSEKGRSSTPEHILVVYLPYGNSNDAALLAKRFLEEYGRGKR